MTVPSSKNEVVATKERLRELYPPPGCGALIKEIDHINAHYRAFIEHAPFFALATIGPDGLDCSPRGDARGFVRVQDAKTLLVPDRPGNNRLDSLTNLIEDARVALLFLIPGCSETLRVNGRAVISADETLLRSFSVEGKIPRTVLMITVERVYYQCGRALVRSKLWDPSLHVNRDALPTIGAILKTLSDSRIGGDEFDRSMQERLRAELY